MSIYTKFAIIGAGGVGGTVVDELLKKGASVTILTRDDSKEELHAFKARGATLIKVAYDDEVALKKALTGSEVAVLGCNFNEGYMNVVGKGETAFSITPRTDVGRFVAQVLATTPKSALEGAEIAFEAEGLSPLQIRDIAEKKLGKKIEVRHVDYEENKKKVDTDFMAFLTTLLEDGHSLAGSEQEVKANVEKFFPDWNPAKYESFVA